MGAISIKLGEQVFFDVTTHSPSGGFSKAADETPAFRVFEEETDTPIIGPSGMYARSGFVGLYRGNFLASAGNGFEAGKFYSVIASGKVENISAQLPALLLYAENNNLDSLSTGIVLSNSAMSGIWNLTVTELNSVPQFPVTYGQMATWLFEKSRNYGQTTDVLDKIFKDDGTTPLASSILSDNGTTFIHTEYQ